MAKKVNQATIIIMDIGRNVSTPDEKEEKCFFSKARECTSRIIERKILSQGQDLIGVILLGSKSTVNPLAEQVNGNFRNINILSPLQIPTWQMIRDLPETATKSKGSWFDALLVAADHFANGISGVKIESKKIILITNFLTSTIENGKEIEQTLNGFKEEGYEVDVFGPDLYSEDNNNSNIKLARQFVEATKGATATIEYTMRYLLFHRKKAVNPTPWNVDLSIGPNIKIPVSTYIKIKNEPIVKKWLKAVKDPVTNTASKSEAIVKSKIHINTETQSAVDDNLVIKGYQYGQQYIPFGECDKALLYHAGPKSLSLYGFTSSKNISWQNLNDDGLTYVFGRKNDLKAQNAIICLACCLSELDLVGIVRRVYNNGNAPKMYVLMPVIDNDKLICLSMAQICYKDDVKLMIFPPTNLKKYDCTDEQVNVFKDLIKAMDLMKAYDEMEYDDTEAFPIAETVSPSAQYVLDCIAFRAMNPGKPLPEPRQEIKMLFEVPPLIEKRSREPLEKLKSLFTLNKIEKKQKAKNVELSNAETISHEGEKDMDSIPKIKLDSSKVDSKLKIGTLDPINDYETLKMVGKSFDELAGEMSSSIESMMMCNLVGDYKKAFDAMSHFRQESVKNKPTYYNDWLKCIKQQLVDLKKEDILNTINNKNLNFILESENSLSNMKCEDDSGMYDNDTVPMSTDVAIDTEINDLFDNM